MFDFICVLLTLRYETDTISEGRQVLKGKIHGTFTDQAQLKSQMDPFSIWESLTPFDCFRERSYVREK